MKTVLLLIAVIALSSCWKPYGRHGGETPYTQQKVWGSKPVYAAISAAKKVIYTPQKEPLLKAGNIYAYGKYIFQVDHGRGIHVIDNSDPATADRIGFITVKGCEQISIKGGYIYTNSYADLVTLDISDPKNMREVSRVSNAFPELGFSYYLAQPEESGYYLCPAYDSVVVAWVKDSIINACYKN